MMDDGCAMMAVQMTTTVVHRDGPAMEHLLLLEKVGCQTES
jgi:hypothetical protein